MDFQGKTALITGSGAIGGLGHTVATILVAGGADVVITGRDPQRGAQVVDDLAGHARFIQADLADTREVRQLADEAGLVDILINNAAIVPNGPTAEQDLDVYEQTFAINVRAPFILTAALAPKMAANGGGSIVNITSTAAGIGMAGVALYGATKAALESLTRAWAPEFAPMKVRVNAVSPGPMRSSKMIAVVSPDAIRALGDAVPMARTADPIEVAEVVAFLAGDRASYMTGAIVPVDGGWTAAG
ncbi:SDR family NAD(P)-dependent oxidoreductase [Nocardia sp. NPDC051052]|uniref:SDR family NAD(P)-dependent oxidoreductase n=1 Tax=Nocardia sp. NPDC051052 TaxID=3364322 RepID=UPI0037AF6312